MKKGLVAAFPCSRGPVPWSQGAGVGTPVARICCYQPFVIYSILYIYIYMYVCMYMR